MLISIEERVAQKSRHGILATDMLMPSSIHMFFCPILRKEKKAARIVIPVTKKF